MYACLRGDHHDGHSFAPAAVAAGALVAARRPSTCVRPASATSTQLIVDDTRLALGPIAAAVNGDPSTALRVVGITGTNGKTTTSMLVAVDPARRRRPDQRHRHAVGRLHHPGGAGAAGPPRRASAIGATARW